MATLVMPLDALPTPTDDERTRFHEAGHAAYALVHGYRRVSINLKTKRWNGMKVCGICKADEIDDRTTAHNTNHYIGFSLAGGVAESIVLEVPLDSPEIQHSMEADVADLDCTIECELLSRDLWSPPSADEIAEYRHKAVAEVENELRHHWSGVKNIADSLRTHRTLSSKALAKIWRGTQ